MTSKEEYARGKKVKVNVTDPEDGAID